jgi:MFS family permease
MSATRVQSNAGNGASPGGRLSTGTLAAAAVAVCAAQVALAIPAVLQGLWQQDLGTSASQLTWMSDAFLVPVVLLELTFGVLGDLFGRKRLLVGGALLLALGELVSVLTPGASASTDTRVVVLWIGQALAGIGCAAMFPASLAVVAAGTHNARERGRVIAIYAAALSTGGFISPVLGGALAKLKFGSDPNASWRWAFIAVIVLALLSAAVSIVRAEDSSSPEGRSLDWPGQITIAIGLFALLFAVIQAPTAGWGSTQVVVGFVVAVIFLGAFFVVERRTSSPLLRLELFAIPAFAIASIATVLGMFGFLGTAYASSIRLSAIQGFSPLTTSIAFVLIQGFALLLLPLIVRMMHSVNPRWMLGGGLLLIAIGDFWASAQPVTNVSIAPMVGPLVVVGIGFAFAISSLTAVAVNTVRIHLAGMASATTSMLRDFGFTLGPALVGAIALSRAASTIHAKVAASPSLQHALTTFYGSVAKAPAAQQHQAAAAVAAVKSGPLGANAVPATMTLPNGHTAALNPLKDVAFHALGHAYSFGYVVVGCSAAAAAALVLLILRTDQHHDADELAVAESEQHATREPQHAGV